MLLCRTVRSHAGSAEQTAADIYTDSYEYPDRDCNCHRLCHTDHHLLANSYATPRDPEHDAYTIFDTNPDTHRQPHRHSDRNTTAIVDSIQHAHADGYPGAQPNTNHDADSCPSNGYPHTDQHANSNTLTYSHVDDHTHTQHYACRAPFGHPMSRPDYNRINLKIAKIPYD